MAVPPAVLPAESLVRSMIDAALSRLPASPRMPFPHGLNLEGGQGPGTLGLCVTATVDPSIGGGREVDAAILKCLATIDKVIRHRLPHSVTALQEIEGYVVVPVVAEDVYLAGLSRDLVSLPSGYPVEVFWGPEAEGGNTGGDSADSESDSPPLSWLVLVGTRYAVRPAVVPHRLGGESPNARFRKGGEDSR